MRLCLLGSGSSGNCIYLSSGEAGLLIDVGLSGKETMRRLNIVGVDVAGIAGICLTHEHGDHINGLPALWRQMNVDVYANSGTIEAVEKNLKRRWPGWKVFTTGSSFQIADMELEPFSVGHDSYDPVGFVVRSGDKKVCVATDLGMVTALVRERFRECDAIVIEANHDERMLREAARPWQLKQRIAGRQGHLSNKGAAALVADIASSRLRYVFLAHLSSDCNTPALATSAVTSAVESVGLTGTTVVACSQEEPCQMVEV